MTTKLVCSILFLIRVDWTCSGFCLLSLLWLHPIPVSWRKTNDQMNWRWNEVKKDKEIQWKFPNLVPEFQFRLAIPFQKKKRRPSSNTLLCNDERGILAIRGHLSFQKCILSSVIKIELFVSRPIIIVCSKESWPFPRLSLYLYKHSLPM